MADRGIGSGLCHGSLNSTTFQISSMVIVILLRSVKLWKNF